MRPGMRGIMSMTEANGGNDSLEDLKQVLFGAFPDFPRRQSRRGVGDKQRAQAFPQIRTPNERLNPVGEIDDLLKTPGADPQYIRHSVSLSRVRLIIDNPTVGGKALSPPSNLGCDVRKILEQLAGNFHDEGIETVAAEIGRPDEIATGHVEITLGHLVVLRPSAGGIEIRHDRSDHQLRE